MQSFVFFHLQIFNINQLFDLCCHQFQHLLREESYFSCHSQVRLCWPAKLQPHAKLMLTNLFSETHFLSPYSNTYSTQDTDPVSSHWRCREAAGAWYWG